MFRCKVLSVILALCTFHLSWTQEEFNYPAMKEPTVLVVLLARNKEHILPYFLTLFEQLDYPKERMALFIRSDHNEDETINVLEDWLRVNRRKFHLVDVILDQNSPSLYPEEERSTQWPSSRFRSLINMKEEALRLGRSMWADFIWFLDVDVMLTKPDVLRSMLTEEKAIVSPMLKSLGTYSNYWCGMTDDYWYKRTDEYLPILDMKEKGCFIVPMVHSCVLVDLTRVAADFLTFNPDNLTSYDGPHDDIITFAISAKKVELQMYICNKEVYGYIPPPLEDHHELSHDLDQLLSLKLEVIVLNPPLTLSTHLAHYEQPLPKKDKLNYDHIYLINLLRRPDRRQKMIDSFDLLGIEVEVLNAVDGKLLNSSHLKDLGVQQLPGYKDPWSKRDMTFGEIGCFLSHYLIWRDVVDNGYDEVLVFEDDIRFEPYFRDKIQYMRNQIDELDLDWDLIYIGRKKLQSSDEPWVEGSDILVHVDYSYWTLCYALSLEGARKLLEGKPLTKLIPVDEYLPIMFNKHPEESWKEAFEDRTLIAFSTAPLIVFPTHYTGDEGYISDTEESSIIEDEEEIKSEHLEVKSAPAFGVGVTMDKEEL
ncbi:glycosyltransferase 25 family member [Oratosquilla oratoria]|uniref:glycosyltransferase 25 family member n=1 Tax=Oratosquilla oratoria TaxID=337810 RepID=UPI003F76EBE8